jgi:AraC-like DNA-binding protein
MNRHARLREVGARIYMPVEEALVIVRGLPSHQGQPKQLHPAPIIVLVRDRVAAARLMAACRPTPVHVIHEVADLHAAMSEHAGEIGGVIAEARDGHHEPVGPALTTLMERYPTITVLGYCAADAHHATELRDLARAGVHELLFADVDDHPALLRAKLTRGEEARAAAAVLQEIEGLLPTVLASLVEYCVQYPRDSHEISRIACALGVHRKTLVNWCERAHVPPPSTLVTWVRLLLAVEMLRSPGQSVERVANALEFASATSLRNLCRRYFRLRPMDLRAPVGRAAAYQAFANAVSGAGGAARTRRAPASQPP